MKALKLYGKRDLRYEEADMPTIEEPDDVILKVKTVGICGSDISRYSKLGPYVPGMVWGHEFSGKLLKLVVRLQILRLVIGLPDAQHSIVESVNTVKKANSPAVGS